MIWNRYFPPFAAVLLLVAALHWLASYQGYYWTVEWYDFMMHFLGGMWIALAVLWKSEMPYQYLAKWRGYATTRNILILVLLGGAAWEVLEVLLHMMDPALPGYVWDTTHDLIMDMLGGFVAVKLFKKNI
jgi:hypothetical protein